MSIVLIQLRPTLVLVLTLTLPLTIDVIRATTDEALGRRVAYLATGSMVSGMEAPMAEVLYPFEPPIRGRDGREYHARVHGRAGDGGLWEGWIEFEPIGGGERIETGRETTQPNRGDLVYWATGLRTTYLEGALERALGGLTSGSVSDRALETIRPETRVPPDPRPVLDPFAVYAEGPNILRQQLTALSAAQLRAIAKAYGLAPDPDRLELLAKPDLAKLIADAVALRAR